MKYDWFESKLCRYSITERIKLILNKTISKKSGEKMCRAQRKLCRNIYRYCM